MRSENGEIHGIGDDMHELMAVFVTILLFLLGCSIGMLVSNSPNTIHVYYALGCGAFAVLHALQHARGELGRFYTGAGWSLLWVISITLVLRVFHLLDEA